VPDRLERCGSVGDGGAVEGVQEEGAWGWSRSDWAQARREEVHKAL
jgi:hypothetical protein